MNEGESRDNRVRFEWAGGTRSEGETVRRRWRQSDGGSQSMRGTASALAC